MSKEKEDAIKLAKIDVRYGNLIPVYNKDKKPTANSAYYAIWIKTYEGKSKCLMLTVDAIAEAEERTLKNPEDIPQLKENIFKRIFRFFKK